MTCKEFAEFLLAYESGELSPEQKATFDAHLAHCPCCENYLTSYRATVDLAHCCADDPERPAPPDMPEELIAAILAARKA